MIRLYAPIIAIICLASMLGGAWWLASSHTEARMLKEIAERRINDIQNDRDADDEVNNLTDDELRDRASDWLRPTE